MSKNKKPLKENSFDGSPGGFGGTINTSTGWGTYSSPGNSQYPDRFYQSQHRNSADNQSGGPAGGYNLDQNPPQEDKLQQDVDQLFKKRDTPTPDEVASALQYELGNMIYKDKGRAKEIVLNNLKKDPHFYSNLHHLNIDDKKMDMSEISRRADKKQINRIFQEIASSREKKYEVKPELSEVIQEMLRKKEERSYWKRGLTSEAPAD